MYVPLWCKSNFSFLEGASHAEELVTQAHAFGLPAVAITDRDGVYGIVRAHVKALETGIKLIVGAEMTLEDQSTVKLLAQTRQGYANLCALISRGRLRSAKGSSTVTWSDVCEYAPDLIALWGGERSLLVQEAEPMQSARMLKEAFGDRLYGVISRHRLATDLDVERLTRTRARRYSFPLVAANEVLYHTAQRRPLQDVLTCIRHKVTLPTAGRVLRPNHEYDLKTPHAFGMLFADDPSLVVRTEEIAEQCTFSLAEIRYRYPSERMPSGMTTLEWLRQLVMEGAQKRYDGSIPDKVIKTLDKELGVIGDLDYCGYFLTMWEIVQYCRAQNILCQGRGSAANSAVCFCLGITALDPMRIDLLFERFLSRERAEPPDIDLDIEHDRREEVIQHVYEKYGRTHAAMVANVIRYRGKSATRDVGKALGIQETSLDRVTRMLSHYAGVTEQVAAATKVECSRETLEQLLSLSAEIEGFPRHLSIHPGGFLLGHEPISNLVPMENATMEARTVIQWDKDDVESLGLFKVDLLGLGALTHLHHCFDLLRAHRGLDLEMATIPADDVPTYDMICKADTVGVFQIESRAQMSMLPRLRPRNYYDIVIQVSIVRPGPITGGMVHPYLRRRKGEEEVLYPHPCLEPVLKKTLGIPLFQEQVMSLAVAAADYTPGEADQLRRDMAAWRRTGRMEQHRERLITRMRKKGIEEEFAERVFKQICGFGDYGFPESHAASFALVSYVESWIKCHHPEVFVCGLLNAQPMGFYAPASLIEDAKRHGVAFRPVDVTRSTWDCTLEPVTITQSGEGGDGKRGDDEPVTTLAVRMGGRYIKGIHRADWDRIEASRARGTFHSVEEFAGRTLLLDRPLAQLAEAGALASIDSARRRVLWEVKGLANDAPPPMATSLDDDVTPRFPELSRTEAIQWDYRRKGHSTEGHTLESIRPELTRQGLPTAKVLNTLPTPRRVHYAGIVICRQRPATASGVTFMTLEDETGFVNLVIWKKVFEDNALIARTQSFLGITGQLQNEDGVTHLIAEHFWIPKLKRAPDPVQSRDFH